MTAAVAAFLMAERPTDSRKVRSLSTSLVRLTGARPVAWRPAEQQVANSSQRTGLDSRFISPTCPHPLGQLSSELALDWPILRLLLPNRLAGSSAPPPSGREGARAQVDNRCVEKVIGNIYRAS